MLKLNDYCYALNTFRTLEGKETKARKKADIDKLKDQTATYVETNIYLEEHHFIKNIDKVFDDAPPFFGKMLYIWMAKGFDKVKISFLRFLECLYPLFNLDNRFNHNKIAFQIMDIDRDNRYMTLALNLLERVREEHYSLECMDYWDNTISFEDVPDNQDLKSIEIETTGERFDEYLNKYPSSVRAVIKERGVNDDKKTLCLLVSYYNHNKANKLLFRVLEEKLAQWWD